MTDSEKELPEEKLMEDAAGAELEALASEARDHLIPKERDWEALEAKLLARIDEEIEHDAPSPGLSTITEEAREHLVPAARKWDAIERKVLARVSAGERKRAVLPIEWRGLERRGLVAISAIAAAAAAVIVTGHGAPGWEGTQAAPAQAAGVLGKNDGHVHVSGQLASAGYSAQAGDRIEVGAGRAVFDQTGRVTWALESQSRARVTRTEGGLVLALEQGATEAQVVPVPNGEAFAVDIADEVGHVARVAVHGTHLRVARSGAHVVIDLTEGIVTVGRAPRSGSTYGTLVTAPAHVEFDVGDVDAVRVDHGASAVRPAAVLAFADPPHPVETVSPEIAIAAPERLALPKHETKPTPTIIHRPENVPAVVPPVTTVEPDPATRIQAAATACFATSAGQPTNGTEVHTRVDTRAVVITIVDGSAKSTSLVDENGHPSPVEASIQTCISTPIWSMRFEGTTTLKVLLDLQR